VKSFRLLMVVLALVFSGLALNTLPARASSSPPPMKFHSGPLASASYTIDGEDAEAVFGCEPEECDVPAYAGIGAGKSWTWVNEGGDCLGSTCWEIQDPTTGFCISVTTTSSGSHVADEYTCSTANEYDLWTNPPTNGSFGAWDSYGMTVHESDGQNWGVQWNSSNDGLYIVASPGAGGNPAGAWTLNG